MALLTALLLLLNATDVHGDRATRRSRCESPTVPTPRSESCRAWNRDYLQRWHELHSQLAQESAAAYRNVHQHPKLLLVGDSISESYRGTSLGMELDRTIGVNASLAPLSSYYSVQIAAISGDETQHLLWRLDHGELSPAIAADPQLHIVLLIGTNNLGNARHSAEATASGVLAVARQLLRRTKAKLLVQSILPRGEGPKRRAARLGEKRPRDLASASLMPSVKQCNGLIAAGVDGALASSFPGRVRRVDCGPLFSTAIPGREVNPTLMPDDLHPNVEGSRLLAECVRGALAKWRREEAAGVHSAPGRAPLADHTGL